MAILLIKSASPSGSEFPLKPGLNRIGRHPSNDIHLDDPSISSFHCELQVAEIGVGVKDLGSTNGTFVNQRQITKAFITGGDLLTLGGVDCVIKLEEVNIVLPQAAPVEQITVAFLEDGTPACFTHREVAANLRCTKCEQWWCNECGRVLKKINGNLLNFCPECSAPCVFVSRESMDEKKGFLGRLQETLRLTRKK
jgi:hypothetical protein